MPINPAGSTNLASSGIPNTLVNIIPPNPLLNGIPTNIIGVVGTATWGQVNAPTTIGSLSDLVFNFGTPQPVQYDLGTQVYNAMLQGANNFLCVRATDGTDVKASLNVLDQDSAIGAIISSIYTGALPNPVGSGGVGFNAVLDVGSGSTMAAPTFKMSLYFNGGVPEVFDNIGGSGVTFWNNLVNAINLGQNNIRGPSQLCTALTNNNISSVTVNTAGSYTVLPTLGTSGPGSGAVLNPIMKAVTAVDVAAGTSYAPADTITLTGGTHSASTVLTVATTKLVSAAVNAGGSGYNVNDTITLAGGTFSTAAILTVASVDGSGAVLTFTIANHGSYTVDTSSFTQGSTSGIGSGATFNTAVWGVNTVTISTPGSYTALPSNPVSQGSTSGSGSGATFTMDWGLLSVVVSSVGSGYTSASLFTVSGSGGATGTLNLGSALLPSTSGLPVTYTMSGGANGNTNVTDATLIGSDVTPRTGMYALRQTATSIGVVADQTNPTYWTNQNAFGSSEGVYMIATIANGYQQNIASAISVRQTGGVTNYDFKLMMGDWCYLNDPFNNVTRLVSPQSYVAGVLATILPSNSSLNKIMNGVVATQKSSSQAVYSDADLLALQTAGIDVITNSIPAAPNSGAFGVRLGVNSSSSILTNQDNYPRMNNFLADTFDLGLGQFIGLPQTPDVQNQARGALQTFLQNLVSLGLIGTIDGSPAFRVILDSTNNPPNQVARGLMQADVQVVLFSIILTFVINLQANQGVQIKTLPVQLVA